MAPAGYGNRVEGLHAVEAAARAGRIERLWVEERRVGRADVAALVEAVGRDRVSVVKDVRPQAETEVPQGLVADCRPILPVTLDALAGDDRGTAHDFGGGTHHNRLDHIFVSPDIEVVHGTVVADGRTRRLPSDHWPVLARLRLPRSA